MIYYLRTSFIPACKLSERKQKHGTSTVESQRRITALRWQYYNTKHVSLSRQSNLNSRAGLVITASYSLGLYSHPNFCLTAGKRKMCILGHSLLCVAASPAGAAGGGGVTDGNQQYWQHLGPVCHPSWSLCWWGALPH